MHRTHPECSPRRAGISAIEMIIAVTILGLVFGSMAMVSRSTDRAYRTGVVVNDVQVRGQSALERVVEALRDTQLSVLDPQLIAPFSSSALTYQSPTGVVGGVMQWSDPLRFEFQYDALELDDGIDNDGDGLVDEGRLVQIRDLGLAEEKTIVLCTDVCEALEGETPNGLDDNDNGLIDESGLCFSFEGSRITVRLTLERIDQEGNRITRTLSTAVAVRN